MKNILKRQRGFVLVAVSIAIAVGLIAALILGIYGLFRFKDPVMGFLARQVPVEWERQLGQSSLRQILQRGRFVTDPDIRQMMTRISDPVLNGIPQDRYEFSVYILDDPAVNAFALPGGPIVFNSGLLLAAQTPGQVAGVLAHEAAHVTLQHGLQQMMTSVGLFTAVQVVIGDASALVQILARQGMHLITQKYSRDAERDADALGWEYMTEAGFDPRGMLNFFETLRRLEGQGGGDGVLSFLSTHPTTEDRIERLREQLPESGRLPDYRRFDIDFTVFQERLRRVTTPAGNG